MYRAAILTTESAPANPRIALRYVHDDKPGYSRQRVGKQLHFVDPAGKRVSNRRTLARLTALRIPPAWTDVWICPARNGHLQVTGRDQRGRKQYLYHEAWTAQQAEKKYTRILEFAAALPQIRRRVARDFARRGLSREKVLAAVLRLMECTLIRVGNEQYVKENDSYGLTTLRDRHAQVRNGHIRLRFRGKSGKWHECDVADARLATTVRRCQELPGEQLLQYLDEQGRVHDITSADVNAYLHDITGGDFSAKDFRTWSATSQALWQLCQECSECSATAAKRRVSAVIDCVAGRLNNTRTVCRKSYIHPGVIEAYLDRSLPQHYQAVVRKAGRAPRGLSKEEHVAREVLRALAKRSQAACAS